MMDYIEDLLDELNLRLPELSWKLGTLNPGINRFHLPHGLFRSRYEAGGEACIQEIKTDIQNLLREKNSAGALYLAERIKQKVSVLVRLCQLDETSKQPLEQPARFALKELSTRKQWFESLEQELEQLKSQHQALSSALERSAKILDTQRTLAMQHELGQIEKRMTLVKEDLKTMTGA